MSDARAKKLLEELLASEVSLDNSDVEMSDDEKKLWEIFEEKPVSLEEFVAGEKYLNRPTMPLSEIQYDLVRHMEQILFQDTYELMAKCWDEYWTPSRRVNNLVFAAGKGCMVAGERIYNSGSGEWERIEDFQGGMVSSVDQFGSVVEAESSASFLCGSGECFEVTTRLGSKIRVYGGHKFLTEDGWKELWDLEVGDSIGNARPTVEEGHVTISDCGKTKGDVVWDEIKSIEPIGEHAFYDVHVDGTENYIGTDGIVSHNSGKDYCIQVAFARIAYLLLCIRSPQKYFGMPDNTFIHMLNVAISAPQAHSVFFKPLRELIAGTEWFSDKFAGGKPPGPQATTIRLIKNIEMVSGHSQADSMEGKNLIAAVADEIAGFATEATSRSGKAPMKTAEGIIKMLKSSAMSRFPETYKLVQISFARYQGDPIMQALDEAKKSIEEFGEESSYYASGPHRTWDVNPRYQKYEFIEIPQTDQPVPNVPDIIAEYRKNAAFAKGYYECKPSAAANAYFKDKDKVKKALSEKRTIPPVMITYYWGVDDKNNEKYPGWQVNFTFSDDFRPKPGAVYAIHADMALKDDRAGLAMCHVEKYNTVETSTADGSEREEMRPVVKLDFVNAFEYDAAAVDPDGNSVPREIQVRWFRKLVMALSDRGFIFGSVSQDGWQSTDSLQILQAWGYEAQKVSADVVSTPVWQTLRDLMYDGRFRGYEHKLLYNELITLEKQSNGKIDHTATSSKDLADAVACSATRAIECGGQEEGDEDMLDGSSFSSAVADYTFGAYGIPSRVERDDEFGSFNMNGTGLW